MASADALASTEWRGLMVLLEVGPSESLAAELLQQDNAVRICPLGGRQANVDAGKLQMEWVAFHRCVAHVSARSVSSTADPIDKASLAKAFTAAGFPQQRRRWGDASVYAITSPGQVAVLDAASVSIVMREMIDTVLKSLLHPMAVEIHDRGVKRRSAEASAAMAAATPAEGVPMLEGACA